MISIGASACIQQTRRHSRKKRGAKEAGTPTLICPSDAANIAPVFVHENASRKIVVTL
jgi:hypothetical protein